MSRDKQTLSIEEKLLKAITAIPKRNKFLSMLYDVLEKPQYENVMCWNSDGKAFLLKDQAAIEDKLLKKEFDGMKFSSFIRQLSYYGFKRVSQRAVTKEYSHEQFLRGQRDLLKQIKRNQKEIDTARDIEHKSVSKNENSAEIIYFMDQKISAMQAEFAEIRAENMALKFEVQRLKRKLNEENTVSRIEAACTQDPSSHGFSQTFFNPQTFNYSENSTYLALNTKHEGPNFLPVQSSFIELYQPDCKIRQSEDNFQNLIEVNALSRMDTPLSEERSSNHYSNNSSTENFEDNYWAGWEEPF